ncbi:ligase-associated DNA damage response endonuclease PdeM [bacterium]|nr:ligase-associated DNA damage response endonuclease PdeM [bacterium]
MSCAVKISLLDYELELLPEKGVYWNQHDTLFVADTHLGKEATFRYHSIPVPDGSTAGTLRTITQMVQRTRARSLVILGDMFHAKSSLSDKTHEQLQAFRQLHPELRIKLVLGNHDRPLGTLPASWEIDVIPAGEFADGLAIGHEPENIPTSAALMLCGHLHPAVRLTSAVDQTSRLPCFWWHKKRLILPAIGGFTGCTTIRPTYDDRVWVVAEGTVLAYPNRGSRKSNQA